MDKPVLLTFGCSWTYGEGSGYVPGMSREEYEKIQHDPRICWENGWRKKVVQHFDFEHINFAEYGSSNDRQFRVAKKFFISKKFKEFYSQKRKIFILWGTTSLNRYDLWVRENRDYEKIFLEHAEEDFAGFKQDKDRLALTLKKYSYDENERLRSLESNMAFYNQYFKLIGVKNFWFDTFNPFRYKINFNNFILHKDNNDYLSLSRLIERDHKSKPGQWTYKSGFEYLINNNLVNPYSYHPLKEYYSMIGDYFIHTLSDKI